MPFTLAEQKCSLVFTKSKHITSRRIMLLMAAISICLDINNPFGCLFLCQQFSIPWEKNVFWILQVNKVKDTSNLSALYYCPSQNTSEARNGRTQLLGVLRYCRAWLCRLSFGVHFLWLPRKVCSSRKRGMEIKEDDRRPSQLGYSQKPRPETEICMQRLHCGSDSRKEKENQGERNKKRGKPIQRCIIKLSTAARK